MSGPLDVDAARRLILDGTVLSPLVLVPEIRLHMAEKMTPLWEASEAMLAERGIEPPYWAFAWVGGQALARWVLDNPEVVRGKRVRDVGCGSGVVAIAAAMAGAVRVEAIDLDPVALLATDLNAAANGVVVQTLLADATYLDPEGTDTVLCGDICYEWEVAERLALWMRASARAGADVLLGDPGRMFLPQEGLVPLARYTIATTVELEDKPIKETGVFRFPAPA